MIHVDWLWVGWLGFKLVLLVGWSKLMFEAGRIWCRGSHVMPRSEANALTMSAEEARAQWRARTPNDAA